MKYIGLLVILFINMTHGYNILDINFYNNNTDCINNVNSIVNFTKKMYVDCGCTNTEICLKNMDVSNLNLDVNNNTIQIKDLSYQGKCNIYRNLFYTYNIDIYTTCALSIFLSFMVLSVLTCTLIYIYTKIRKDCISKTSYNNLESGQEEIPPNYNSINE